MKRINQKEHQRFDVLVNRLCDEFSDHSQQSTTIGRGDVTAIKWAAWWIRETIEEHAAHVTDKG